MSLLIFLIVLGVLIIVHEWGHFMAARFLGIGVEKFSIGFGPKLFSRHHKGTDFMVSAIPLGGYVKLAGDERSACTGRADEFYSRPVGHRALVVMMGPVVNFIFAYLCFYLILVTGFPMAATTVGKVMDDYPAQEAGLLEGDRITKIDGEPVQYWEDLQSAVNRSQGQPLQFTVARGDGTRVLRIEPRQTTIKNIFGKEMPRALIGVQPGEDVIFARYGIFESFGRALAEMVQIITMTLTALFHVFAGSLPAKDALAGPVRIFDVVKQAAEMGFAYLTYITAVISTSLGLFNLFPIPVLDGGHLLFFGIEKIRRRPLPEKVEEGFVKAGFGLLMLLMVFVFYNDIVEVGWIDQARQFIGRFTQ
ncbi:MAG: RIP metalloprotease RseP [Candidatus Omnitrophota bacterium]